MAHALGCLIRIMQAARDCAEAAVKSAPDPESIHRLQMICEYFDRHWAEYWPYKDDKLFQEEVARQVVRLMEE